MDNSAPCSGLKWMNIGTTRPNPGEELTERLLVEALGRGFTEFTDDEWERFGIEDLRMDHYVSSRGSFYVPSAVYNAVPVGQGGGASPEKTGLTSRTRWRKGAAFYKDNQPASTSSENCGVVPWA